MCYVHVQAQSWAQQLQSSSQTKCHMVRKDEHRTPAMLKGLHTPNERYRQEQQPDTQATPSENGLKKSFQAQWADGGSQV